MSKLKGKLAGVVFQQYEGLNVAKEYQPNVKNPSTAKQVEGRAKFKAASQLVAVFADIFMVAIAKVSPYSRTLRGALVRVLTRSFTWDGSDSRARIDNADVANAVNSLAFNPSVSSPVIAGANISSATITATAGDTVRYKIVALDADGNIIGSAEETFEATSTPASIQAPLTPTTPDKYTIAAVATRPDSGSGYAMYGNLSELSQLDVLYGVASGDILSSLVTYAEIAQG